MEKFEIVELGYPQSIIQRENEPITALIETKLIIQQLESRINELENNTTELIEVFSNESGYVMQCNSCKEKNSIDFQSKFNF